jgi:hypothetical protein
VDFHYLEGTHSHGRSHKIRIGAHLYFGESFSTCFLFFFSSFKQYCPTYWGFLRYSGAIFVLRDFRSREFVTAWFCSLCDTVAARFCVCVRDVVAAWLWRAPLFVYPPSTSFVPARPSSVIGRDAFFSDDCDDCAFCQELQYTGTHPYGVGNTARILFYRNERHHIESRSEWRPLLAPFQRLIHSSSAGLKSMNCGTTAVMYTLQHLSTA